MTYITMAPRGYAAGGASWHMANGIRHQNRRRLALAATSIIRKITWAASARGIASGM
jgi:hypothetical protein